MIIDGKEIAQKLYDKIKDEVTLLDKKPTLGAILVGNNSASLRYIGQKKKWAEYVGIDFDLRSLDENIKEKDLLKLIKEFNESENISGFIVQLPLPPHIDTKKVINAINPKKDVDGFTPENQGKISIGDITGLAPCTPAGVMHILKYLGLNLIGKNVTVIGRSNIVGKPVTMLLMNAGATVINCNSKTKHINNFTQNSDIVICAAGVPKLLKLDMIKFDTTVIDVGFTVVGNKIYGDADFENINRTNCKITPVPGGVGPLTVAMLMKNTLKAHKN